MSEDLKTTAPLVQPSQARRLTGNLTISLPTIFDSDASIDRVGVISDQYSGLVEACGSSEVPLVMPMLADLSTHGLPELLDWSYEVSWIPRFDHIGELGHLTGWIVAPTDECERRNGFTLKLQYHNTTQDTRTVRLGWSGAWIQTELTHFRAKRLRSTIEAVQDDWTGACVLAATEHSLPLAIGIRGGEALPVQAQPNGRWEASALREAEPGETVAAELFVAVAKESDGASTTALSLRRLGFNELHRITHNWLTQHALPIGEPGAAVILNRHLFFNYFFAQADCLDSGRPVIITSRSQSYYVSAAFWSRDAYCWTFPALLLTSSTRARRVLLETISRGEFRLANHALYIDGTELYPGFELDQAAAPIVAIWRYIQETKDLSLLAESPIRSYLAGWLASLGRWFNSELGLYATHLMPTDDPTEYPFQLTSNAFLATAFEAIARMSEWGLTLDRPADEYLNRAALLKQAMRTNLVYELEHTGELVWAWACDRHGSRELREEPPLSLRLLPYFNFCDLDDPIQAATDHWIETAYEYHYDGKFGGAGSAHFPFPSGFDLAARLLTELSTISSVESQLEAPMDDGFACESWDSETGYVRTGAGMASMAGYLAWTWWARLIGHRQWDDPLTLSCRGSERIA